MTFARNMAVSVLIGMFLSPAIAVGQTVHSDTWSDRGVFVFDDLVIDFRHRVEKSASGNAVLTDCSTTEFYCATGSVFVLSIPRDCGPIAARVAWTGGGVTTRWLGEEGRVRSHHERGNGPLVYIGNPERPWVVYGYDRLLGVIKIYSDDSHQQDFVAMARADTLSKFEAEQQEPGATRRYVRTVTTLDAVGQCKPLDPDRGW